MQVTYCTEKRFPDGSTEIILKDGYRAQLQNSQKARITRLFNELEKRQRLETIADELNKTPLFEQRKRHKLELLLNCRNLDNLKRSARRARQMLYDICKCNEFLYFVTLTFDKDKVDRLNDRATRRKFSQWANAVRKQFPDMFYVATPEYHKKGGLHFHLLVGGISFDDLAPVFWKTQTKGKHKGQPIYNVTAWKYGYSTMTAICEQAATKHYICKYITKQHFDDRFFNKRRYYCSHNIIRPEIVKETLVTGNPWDMDLNVWRVAYLDDKKRYGVFTHDGLGVVDTEYNAADVREKVCKLSAARARGAGASSFAATAPRARARVPHLTIGTLNSVEDCERRKQTIKELNERINREKLERDIAFLRDIGLWA